MNLQRATYLRDGGPNSGPVVYWMSRDQRVNDNWALCLAQSHALEKQVPLIVIFCLVPRFLDASLQHYNFMLKGLQETESSLKSRNISFFLLAGEPGEVIPSFMEEQNAGTLITDYSPLRLSRAWKKNLAARLHATIIEVDAHNIVPVWKASTKREYAASTMRPKLYRLLPEFLDDFPAIVRHPYTSAHPAPEVHWEQAASMVRSEMRTTGSPSCEPGEAAARRALEGFLHRRLSAYGAERNDPTLDGQSHLSPYLHFGHISAQRIALEVQRREETPSSTDFLEELIVRRELADNFCHYNDRYDSLEGFPEWAKLTLNMHRNDERTHRYTLEEFEQARTHDRLWNAAQGEMLTTGRMHGYMRMYWAKKILEWSASPEEALAIAVYLNDTYELDGRDPNGYAGIAWSIGGVHDRAWGERPVYGKVRYMNANGCARKFDVNEYCRRFA